ncbi:hypothetical protein [Elizabethkingia ursingii]|uniref:hypothetical protein n=1 Tax=Elizabethkingia ursingii TaxID=1756150 RepID=UPI002013155F|nr:hypothetical protein [Elizabethkingia ursingii]MCL1671741.1 hypothetical protein [Elizabethkingia ursingii]
MDLKEFLEDNPIINMSQLAKEMWPTNKSARIKLFNKLHEKEAGSGKQRITEKDMEDAKTVLKKLSDDINKL